MILESIPLAGAEQRRSEATLPANFSRARRGEDARPVVGGQSYSRVADEIAEGKAMDRTERTRSTESAKGFSLWENSAVGFGDFVDIVNPLQYIPIIATIYRNLTGDRIGMAPRVIGGALWGRIGGLVSGVINSVVEWFTGKDIGDHIYAALRHAPDKWVKQSAAAKSASENGAESNVLATSVMAVATHEAADVADDAMLLDLAAAHQEIDSAITAASHTEPEQNLPPHIYHLPYRRNDELSEANDGAGKLDLNA